MNKPKKIPIRKCVATLEQHPKQEMFRIVRTPEGEIVIDKTGKTRGRGAYLLKDEKAIKLSMQKKILDRHLEINVPNEIYQTLLEMLGDKSDS